MTICGPQRQLVLFPAFDGRMASTVKSRTPAGLSRSELAIPQIKTSADADCVLAPDQVA
ncbi:hypothetical protein NB311A_16804 [Nitrobacter sp. Nb-311A]|nr:hypothetical protein NB311A_16804 [Nitrobacter sp. Nb-311A]